MAITAQMRTEVSQLFVALFMRAPAPSGLDFYTGELDAGTSLVSVAQEMYNTDPARVYYPDGATSAEIVTAFFTNVLGRAPAAGGLAHYVDKLDAAKLADPLTAEGKVIVEMITDVMTWVPSDPATDAAGQKSLNLFTNKVVVAEYYAEVLMGDAGGATDALNAITDTTDVSDSAAIELAIALGSAEFALTAGAASADEGTTATFDLVETSGLVDGTQVTYTISGISAADVVGGSLTGKATLVGGKASIAVPLKADTLTEGAETLTVTVDGSTTVTASSTVNDTSITPVPGKNLNLTIAVDAFDGTVGNDTFTSVAGTLQDDDIIFDAPTNGDSDVMNIALTAAGAAATISNIENINVTVDSLAGATATFDASNVFGSTINMKAGKVIDGTAVVDTLGTNNLTAGTGISILKAINVGTGVTIDLGAATTFDLDSDDAGNDITININGSTKGVIGSTTDFDKVKLNVTKASTLTLDTGTGTGDVSVVAGADLLIKGAQLLDGEAVAKTGTGILTAQITAAGAVGATLWTGVSGILLTADMATNALTVASGQVVTATTSVQDALGITAGTAELKDVVTLITGVNHTTSLDFTDFEEITVKTTANITIDDLTSTVGADKLILLGSSTLTVTTSDVDNLDASGYAGTLNFTGTALDTIKSGTGTGKFVIANQDTSFEGQGGKDTIDARLLTVNGLTAALGGGDDTIKLGAIFTTGTLTSDGGANNDTLWLKDEIDASLATVTLSNFEKVEMENLTPSIVDDALAATVAGSMLSGKTLTVTTAETADMATFNVLVDKATTDLTNIIQTNIDVFNITGRGTASDVIKGTAGKDVIETGNDGAGAGAAAKATLTGNGGNDTFAIHALDSGVSAADVLDVNNIVSITDFNMGASSFDKLLLDITDVQADIAAVNTVDVSSATTDTVAGDLFGVMTKGIVTLHGLSADKATINTLVEWIEVAKIMANQDAGNESVLAFEFGGNTYVVTDDGAGGAGGDLIDNVIQLTGVTGVTGISSTTAAANVIMIALFTF